MSKSLLTIICSTLMLLKLNAQSRLGIENYYYPGETGKLLMSPLLHFEMNNSLCGEIRYNYEDRNTLSFFAGKTISGGRNAKYTISPMLGYSTGTFQGISAGINIDGDWGAFYFSSQSQYSRAMKEDCDDFIFSWSELGYNLSDHLYGGIAMQYTGSKITSKIDPGLVVGVSIGNLSLPVYLFNLSGPGRYVVVGLTFEYNLKRKTKAPAL